MRIAPPEADKQQKHPDGTVVHKVFRGFGWYQGEVVSFDGELYKVRYSDGDEEEYEEVELDNVLEEAKKRPAKYPNGTHMEKFFPGFGWFNGKIFDFDGTYYKVLYEDGDEEEISENEMEDIFEAANQRSPPRFPNGTKVKKLFHDYGVFHGTVINFNGIYYTVLYCDGDQEQYEEDELEKIVLPERR